ncbi:hypothetical protein ACI8AG_09165 [Blastococcus sp. SYSU DS0552]
MTELTRTHLETLSERAVVDGRPTQRRSIGDRVTFFLIPAAIGVALWLTGAKAPTAEPLLAAIAVLTGLLFALLVLMFERIVHERERDAPAAGNDPLSDAWQVLANVSWAILMSLVLLSVLFTVTLFTSKALAPWLTGLVAALFAHLVLTLLMILKRVFYTAMRIAGYRRLADAQR